MNPKAQLWTESVPELQVIEGGVMLCEGSAGIYSFLGNHWRPLYRDRELTRNNRAAG